LLPAVNAKTSTSSYNPYGLDFTNSNSFAFADNCTSNITGTPSACSALPNLVECGYNIGYAEDSGMIIGTFNGMMFSGYNTSGWIVVDEVSINTGSSRTVRLYIVEKILSNTWFYGVANGYGTIGLGVNSPFLKQFVNPENNTLTYGVVVSRSNI